MKFINDQNMAFMSKKHMSFLKLRRKKPPQMECKKIEYYFVSLFVFEK